MLHLLKIEWLKVKNYRTFWVLLIISIISVPSFNYVIYSILEKSFPEIKGNSFLGSPFAFPDVWQTVSFNSSFLLLIPGVLVITLITNEFTYKTHRQNVIDGWSRNQFINVKLLEILLFSILMTVIVFLTSFAFGFFGKAPKPGISMFQELRFTGFFFVAMISYTLIAFVISMLIKRAGLAMGIFFIYMIIEQFIVAILRNRYKIKAADFFPEEVTDMLIPQPYLKNLLGKPGQIKIWESQLATYLLIAATYVFLYCIIASWRFRKSDI